MWRSSSVHRLLIFLLPAFAANPALAASSSRALIQNLQGLNCPSQVQSGLFKSDKGFAFLFSCHPPASTQNHVTSFRQIVSQQPSHFFFSFPFIIFFPLVWIYEGTQIHHRPRAKLTHYLCTCFIQHHLREISCFWAIVQTAFGSQQQKSLLSTLAFRVWIYYRSWK